MRAKRTMTIRYDAPESLVINGKTYRRAQLMRRNPYESMSNIGSGLRLARAYVSDYRKQGKQAYIVNCANGIGVYVR